MLSIGGNVCINIASNEHNGHAFSEVDVSTLGNTEDMLAEIRNKFPQYANHITKLNIRNENGHKWLNLDWFSAYPGGDYYDFNRIQRYTCINGEWASK